MIEMNENPPVKLNKRYEVEVISNGERGDGIAKIENFVLIIPGALKGEIVQVEVVKILPNYCFARLLI